MKKQTIFWILILLFIVAGSTFLLLAYLDNNSNLIQIKDNVYSLSWSTLNFDKKWVVDEEIKLITSKLNNPKYRVDTLYLWWNNITAKGLSYLANIKNDTLKVIDLSNNKTWDAGMDEFLEKNTFKLIDVSGNMLTDKSFEKIMLNNKLSYITTNYNNITDNWFKKILQNKNIEYLSIENNLLTDESINYLSNIENTKIKFLRLKWNRFSSEGIKKLDELKSKNIFDTLSY